MTKRIITAETIATFKKHLIEEEKSAATIEKYTRDVTAFSIFVANRNVDKELVVSYAIIINQCDHVAKRTLSKNGKTIQFYSFDERGIRLSRNTAFMRATADIVEFADDDRVAP